MDAPSSTDPPEGVDERFDADFAAALGRAVKVFRTGLGLGRRELAEAAGLSYSYVTEIENGKKQASAAAQKALAGALGMSVSDLLAAAEDWVGQLRGEVVASALTAEMREPPPPATAQRSDRALPGPRPLRGRASAPAASPPSPSSAEDGARRRQLRWFHTAARRAHTAWSSAAEEAREHEAALGLEDSGVEACLALLRPLLSRLAPGDRERVVDLARRLARG